MTYFKKTCTASCLVLHNREPNWENLPASIINMTTKNGTTKNGTTKNQTTRTTITVSDGVWVWLVLRRSVYQFLIAQCEMVCFCWIQKWFWFYYLSPFFCDRSCNLCLRCTMKTGWLGKLCFQIVFPNCVSKLCFQIVCFSKLWVFQIVFHQTDAMQNTNKGNEKSERENKKEQERMQKKIGSIQNKSNCNDQ